MAHALLSEKGFLEAARCFVRGAKGLAARAGVPEKFNMTLTLAYLGLIAEKMADSPVMDSEAFVRAHPDLLRASRLSEWYSPARLHSDRARRSFVLPDRAHGRADVAGRET